MTNNGPSTARDVVVDDELPVWATSPITITGACSDFPCLLGEPAIGSDVASSP